MEGNRLSALRLRYENTSVNRSRYSKPWDVIFDHPGQGIVQFLVCWLPLELPYVQPNPPVTLHSFYPGHKPEDENYSHSEIWTYKEGVRVEKPSLPNTVKKEFR